MMRIWSFGEHEVARDLVGFDVLAADGSLGRVERQEDDPGRQHLIVDTGVWLFGTSVLVPAGAIEKIDAGERTVTVSFTKEQVMDAPQFTTDQDTADVNYLREVDSYYQGLAGAGAHAAP